jgi:glycine/D-amino acid oxidase-like deaminating enzyme
MNSDVIVIGGGLVGAAIAYGLVRRGVSVLMLDGNDRDHRASNANGGLVWVQSKGMDMPAYQRFTRTSARLWPTFAEELEELTGIDLRLEQNGGLHPVMTEDAFEKRQALMTKWQNQLDDHVNDWEMLDRVGLEKLLPKVDLGPDLLGASFCRADGQVNSLRLLAALQVGVERRGATLLGGVRTHRITPEPHGGFTVEYARERASSAHVVIAAGLSTKELAAQVGLDLPVRPQRGQMLVTERVERFLPMPLHAVTQTALGTVLIGTTKEEVGFDTATTTEAVTSLCDKAIRQLPALKHVKLIRQWAGLRIMTPDGHPIYTESESHPGAFAAVCHSGVTLAAAHAADLADAIADRNLAPSFDPFHQRRFDVSKAA